MSKLRNWSFQELVRFLKDYGFEKGHVRGSHYHYNGRINGEDVSVQVIYSKKERKHQTNTTMRWAIRHSGIPKKYFEEWKRNKTIHKEIIY